jgi:hypothetical protein
MSVDTAKKTPEKRKDDARDGEKPSSASPVKKSRTDASDESQDTEEG